MQTSDEAMIDADHQLENLSVEDLLIMCNDTFDNIKMEEDIAELRSEVESLFVPQLSSKLEEMRNNPKIFYSLSKNLCKCFTFLGNHEKAMNSWKELEQFIIKSTPSNEFSLERNKKDVELSGVYMNMASLAIAQNDNAKTIELYQKAADVIIPWVFEQNDMSPVPSLISVRSEYFRRLQFLAIIYLWFCMEFIRLLQIELFLAYKKIIGRSLKMTFRL